MTFRTDFQDSSGEQTPSLNSPSRARLIWTHQCSNLELSVARIAAGQIEVRSDDLAGDVED